SLRTRAPLADATVVLVERSRYATTDAQGRFRMDSVPDGHYTISFMHPVLDSLDLQAPVVAIDVSGGLPALVALATPGPATAYARICPGVHDSGTGVIIGGVHDVDDRSALADAVVGTEWTEFTVTGGRSAGHRARAVTRSNRSGAYILCGVPADVQLDLYTELAGFTAGPTRLVVGDRLIGRADFAISRRDSAARGGLPGDASNVAAVLPGSASLRGVVKGGDGRPARDVVLEVLGTRRSARTDAAGAFRIDKIPAGTRTIDVRSIGLVPMTFSLDFATNQVRDTTLSIGKQAQRMTPVAVKGQSSTSWMERSGFETRRLQGLGAFVTAEDIARHPTEDLTGVLQGMRGMHVEYGTSGHPMPYLRGGSTASCIPNYFLDGVPFKVDGAEPGGRVTAPFSDLAAIARPEMVKGIEVYSNPGTMPAQYDLTSSTGCGSIVIWTR
ncbi:MAG: carboxypeptidase regulatory-like domain-containing protein, partial [Gemmatimonadales bacterium]